MYTWKIDEHGWVVAKSRLVSRGFKQREAIDFSDTFPPLCPVHVIKLDGFNDDEETEDWLFR